MNDADITGYHFAHAQFDQFHDYLLPAVLRLLDELSLQANKRRVFELDCGNGSVA
jgi:hypothetical protein